MLKIKNYNSEILKDISFELKEKENLIILGENGAGKSTLAKVLCYLITNDKVFFDEENISKITDEKRVKLINYVPPKFSVFDEYITLQEYLELSFIDEVDEEKIERLISLLRLDKLKNKECINFSSGEQQLLLLASSILHNAKITIFDELTANLDIKRLKEVFDILNSEFLEQKIVITHNLDLAHALKYKVLFLKDGKVEFFGESCDFFSNETLKKYYNNAISTVNNHLVVNL